MGSAVSLPQENAPVASSQNLDCGDVVKAKVGCLYFEGVVTAIENDKVHVDFGDNDIQVMSRQDCVRVMGWQAVEVGDTVQVRESRGFNFYVCTVTHVDFSNGQPVYAVNYGDDDIEKGVPAQRVRKLASERSSPGQRWRQAVNAVMAANSLAKAVNNLSPSSPKIGAKDSSDGAKDSFDGAKGEFDIMRVRTGDVVR